MVTIAPGGEMSHVSSEEPRNRCARGWILVLGSSGGVADQLSAELEAIGCDVERRASDAPLEAVSAPPDLVAIVAANATEIDRLSRTLALRFPEARLLGFVDAERAANGASHGALTSRVIDVAALSARPLGSVVQLVLDSEVLASRLVRLTAEMDALLEERKHSHAALEEANQSIRSAVSGLLAALKMVQWGSGDITQPALLDSMRVSLESLLRIAATLPSHATTPRSGGHATDPLHSRR